MSNQGAAATPFANASIYVGDLNPEVTESMLYAKFSQCGSVASIRVCRDTVNRRSLGYAYVNFSQHTEAQNAIEKLNFTDINGRACRVMWSQRDPTLRKNGAGNIFIKNLHKDIGHKALHEIFNQFGNILSCKVAMDEEGNSRGFGFVHFDADKDAKSAIEQLNGVLINDCEVFVGPFRSKKDRPAQEMTFTNVFIKNFGTKITEEEFVALFGEHKPESYFFAKDEEGKPKGFGFAAFKTCEIAKEIVDMLHDKKEVDGEKLYAGRAMKKNERQSFLREKAILRRQQISQTSAKSNLYIKNLPENFSDEKLTEMFAPFGKILSAKVMVDNVGKPRGFGFVNMSTVEEAQAARQELMTRPVEGKPLYIAAAQRKEERRLFLEGQRATMSGYPSNQFMGFNQQGGYPQRMVMQQGNRRQWSGVPHQQHQQRFMGQNPHQQQRGGRHPPQQRPMPNDAVPAVQDSSIADLAPEDRKQYLGERLYAKIEKLNEQNAPRITGMLLDLEHSDLLVLLENDAELKVKVDEATRLIAEDKEQN
eukprot:TRINITY_DN8_c0_g1_i1.p1 TRINITY_DN8_c0_g1~~TRINITY_DN8_c0_g1_i1.p1  ORF type:complete len:548 (+),score=239.70 TRINITY_DN8_c0_g1_i1:40-1644(+)